MTDSSAMADQTSDEVLVQQALDDVEAFGRLIERYERRLKVYILRISSFRVEEAEEILQEVFLKAWKNLRDFDQSLKFSSWLYRIAHNQTISAFRKHHSRGYDKKISLDHSLFELAVDELDIPEELDRQQRAEVVRDVLESLSESYRDVLVLRYFEDLSYEDISDILKKPMGTIATLLNRAKKAFKQSYLHQSRH